MLYVPNYLNTAIRDGHTKLFTKCHKPYFQFSGELNVQRCLLLKSSIIVIPTSKQLEMLDKLHHAHQGIQKCRQQAQQSIWWPGLSCQLADLVNNYSICYRRDISLQNHSYHQNFLHCHSRRWKLIYFTERLLITC